MELFRKVDGYEAKKISNRGELYMFRVVYDFSKPKRRSPAIFKDTGTMEDLMGGEGPITRLWELYDKTMESLKQEGPLTLQERIDGLEKALRSQTEETLSFASKYKSFWATDRLSLGWNKYKMEIHFCLGRSIRRKSDEDPLFRMELIINAPYHDRLEPPIEQTEETKYDDKTGSSIIKEEPTTPPVTLPDGSSLHGTLKRRRFEANSIDTEDPESKKPMLSTSISSSTSSDLAAPPSLTDAANSLNLSLKFKSPSPISRPVRWYGIEIDSSLSFPETSSMRSSASADFSDRGLQPITLEREDSTIPKPIHQDIDEQMARRYHAAGQEIRNSIEDRRAILPGRGMTNLTHGPSTKRRISRCSRRTQRLPMGFSSTEASFLNYAMAPNGKFVQPILGGEDEILKQLSGFYHQVKEAVKSEKELLPIVFDANEKRKSLLASNVYGNGQRVREFFDLEHGLFAGVYLVQLKREVKMARGKAIVGLLIMTGVWTIRLPYPTVYAGGNESAEAQSSDGESDLSDRYSHYTAGSGEIPSENRSIGRPSLKRQLTDPARGADEKRLRRESTSSVDSDLNRPGTETSNLESVGSTASIGNS
ncbi:hypothetical protein HD553DRAFT_326917 [Filobasidium floriforme]|uniref:uncharacterized protein n=1 Tax=Filobasidium floriforme TaxID=5210 RepID=UPI001E8D98F4|nr:uncharacterized protein HD553DRAFT_326917 [Filobasidium floriforme]KAH8078275.1 hypothetical protein HD553DRAFT_326917 [Filobasidium floriforme]